MTFWNLIFRSLRFHARSHLGTLLGAAIGSAVLIGALVVGDSVKESLRENALHRIGQIESAMASGDRFFRDDLPKHMDLQSLDTAVLAVFGAVSLPDNSARANRVQVLGVNEEFWKFSPTLNSPLTFPEDSVALNSALATHLKVKSGDTILLRLQKPSQLSREVPISPQEDFSLSLRLKVSAIVTDQQLGRFSLQANQTPSLNLFISRELLQQKLELKGKANLYLLGGYTAPPNDVLPDKWRLVDAQLELRDLTNTDPHSLELRSERIFLDEPISKAALSISSNATGVLTYFVNELRIGTNTTPYSMVVAASAPIVPAEMGEDEIVINQWLADDLQAKTGDELTLRYFIMGAAQRLEEKTNTFRVRTVVPMEGVYNDRTLMPEFPGIAKAEKTENWDAGFSIDMKKIRPKDEKYWEDFRGTPKAFITLAAGQKIWANRFGNLTAVRFQSVPSKGEIETALVKNINPASVGLRFENIREQALAAANNSEDFGGLFLGFSFFLIGAALILMGLLFQFSVEQRTEEIGTLLALGFRPKQVRRTLLAEGCLIAAIGGIVGTVGGIAYAKGMLHGLNTTWNSAIAGSQINFHVSPVTLCTGLFASIVVSALTIWLVLRKQAKQPARELLAGENYELRITHHVPRRIAEWTFALCGISGAGLIGWAIWKNAASASEIFFSAGSLLLIAGIAGVATLLKKILHLERRTPTVGGLAFRNVTRRRKRSIATVALLASGTFMIVAVGAFRLETSESEKHTSGTGGFTLIGETTLPVVQNLNEKAGKEFFGLDEKDLNGVHFIPLRVRDGDEASCLNLNRAQKPRVLGVNPSLLERHFTFSSIQKGATKESGWSLLASKARESTIIPAIGDAASIQWALKKKMGDAIDYEDERGNQFKLRLVGGVKNSILQGSLIIDESEFLKRFPNESGYRMFLIEAPSKNIEAVSQTLSRALRDVGLEITPAIERLAQLNAVQNTYLNTFQILGGLGLLLGSAGLGVVVLRNVLERRSELAVLTAVGFRKDSLRWLVLSEHVALLCFGLAIGILSAIAAILPSLISPSAELPLRSLGLTLGGVFIIGLISTLLATNWAVRGELLKALRNE